MKRVKNRRTRNKGKILEQTLQGAWVREEDGQYKWWSSTEIQPLCTFCQSFCLYSHVKGLCEFK